MKIKIKETTEIEIGVEIISSHFFGLVKKVKVHYAETPLLNRKPFFVGFWRIKK